MVFKPFSQKQLAVLGWWCASSGSSDCDGIICDGAVRSGKTLCMSLSFVSWAMHEFDGAGFALCGKTVTSLRRNVVTPLLSALRQLGFECRERVSRSLVEIGFGGRVNSFYLFGGKDESSAALIQGLTLGGVLLDEVALMPRSFVEQAVARCSLSGSRLWFNCNPDNPNHWFKREWIDKAKEKNCLYLHFTMSDNPSLSPDIAKRYESLYSGAFYERFVLGKWVAAEGLVYPFFNKASCVCEPPSPPEEYYISCDYGTVNPFSLGLWGRCGSVWYRESEVYYSSKREKIQKTDEEYYAMLEQLAGDRRVKAVIVDPSAASFMECVRRHARFKVIPAKNDVSDGIRRTCEALRSGAIKISPCCTDIIREFSLYRWDDSGVRDSVKKENDHAMDDMRYFVATALYGRGDGLAVIAAERI